MAAQPGWVAVFPLLAPRAASVPCAGAVLRAGGQAPSVVVAVVVPDLGALFERVRLVGLVEGH
jgi:hypothetical protein